MMQCKEIDRYTEQEISDVEFGKHLETCSSCRELHEKIEAAMSLIDLKTELPKNLSASIIARVSEERSRSNPRTSFGTVLQIASVAAAAVFFGVFLGIHSHTISFSGKERSREQAINEYREFHHLNMNHETPYHLSTNNFMN
jgi:anti-sigma factor RsiW